MQPALYVPAREARAVALGAGDRLRIVDVDGGQVADLFAFATDDPTEQLSAAHTRAHVSRLFPKIGEYFVTDRRRPILALVDDTSPGFHDLLMAPCDAQRYAALGHPNHPSCVDNFHAALAATGHPAAAAPHPVNLFMNVPVTPDGDLRWMPAISAAGDAVTLEALIATIVVVSACPQDLVPINGGEPTAIALEISR